MLWRIEGGLVGNGYSKLSYLEYIHTELQKLVKSRKDTGSK